MTLTKNITLNLVQFAIEHVILNINLELNTREIAADFLEILSNNKKSLIKNTPDLLASFISTALKCACEDEVV
jgi:hypothetical protein